MWWCGVGCTYLITDPTPLGVGQSMYGPPNTTTGNYGRSEVQLMWGEWRGCHMRSCLSNLKWLVWYKLSNMNANKYTRAVTDKGEQWQHVVPSWPESFPKCCSYMHSCNHGWFHFLCKNMWMFGWRAVYKSCLLINWLIDWLIVKVKWVCKLVSVWAAQDRTECSPALNGFKEFGNSHQIIKEFDHKFSKKFQIEKFYMWRVGAWMSLCTHTQVLKHTQEIPFITLKLF